MTARVKIPEGERRVAPCTECMRSNIPVVRVGSRWEMAAHLAPDDVPCYGHFTRFADTSTGGREKKGT